MNIPFAPPNPSPDALIATADGLLVGVLAHLLIADAVDLDDDDACRIAVIASGQTPKFADEYLTTIRFAAWQMRAAAEGSR